MAGRSVHHSRIGGCREAPALRTGVSRAFNARSQKRGCGENAAATGFFHSLGANGQLGSLRLESPATLLIAAVRRAAISWTLDFSLALDSRLLFRYFDQRPHESTRTSGIQPGFFT